VVDRVAMNYRRKLQRRAELLVRWQSITSGRRPARYRRPKRH
jgi:hypothetical protein